MAVVVSHSYLWLCCNLTRVTWAIVRLTKPLMKKKKERVVNDECFSYSEAAGMAVLSAADVFKAAPKPGSPQHRRQPTGMAPGMKLGCRGKLLACSSVCLSVCHKASSRLMVTAWKVGCCSRGRSFSVCGHSKISVEITTAPLKLLFLQSWGGELHMLLLKITWKLLYIFFKNNFFSQCFS